MLITGNPALSASVMPLRSTEAQQQSRMALNINSVSSLSYSLASASSPTKVKQAAWISRTDLHSALKFAHSGEIIKAQLASLLLTTNAQMAQLGSANKHQQLWAFPADHAPPPLLRVATNSHPQELNVPNADQTQSPLCPHHPHRNLLPHFALAGRQQLPRSARRDFKPMSAVAKEAGIRYPREPGEKNIVYALRLRRYAPTISIADLSALSETHESILRARPEFKTLSTAAKEARVRFPRRHAESSMAYALRLRREVPNLNTSNYCGLSGVPESTLRNRPEFQTLSAAAEEARNSHPRQRGEQNTAYALRLKRELPSLSVPDSSALSGAKESALRAHSAFKVVPQLAKDAGRAHPRAPHEDDLAYALRLRREIPGISVRNCALISGMHEMTLRNQSAFKTLSAAAEEARAKYPRHSGEGNMDYALRLKKEMPNLSIADYTGLSDVNESTLRNRSTFKKLSLPGRVAGERFPRGNDEDNMAYALRLKEKVPNLNIRDYSGLSGVTETSLWSLPAFKILSAAAEEVKAHYPRNEGEDNMTHALRLKEEAPALTIADYSLLTGVRNALLRSCRAFKKPSMAAHAAEAKYPRRINEANMTYALRLKSAVPTLRISDCSILSRVSESTLRNRPIFKRLSVAAKNAGAKYPRQIGEKDLTYALRLRREVPNLGMSSYSGLSWINEATLRKRFKDEPTAPWRAQRQVSFASALPAPGLLDLEDLYCSPPGSPAPDLLDLDNLFCSSPESPAPGFLDLDGLPTSPQRASAGPLLHDEFDAFEEYSGTPQASPAPSLPTLFDRYFSSPAAPAGAFAHDDFAELGDYVGSPQPSPAPSLLALDDIFFTPPVSPLIRTPTDHVLPPPAFPYWIVYENADGEIQSVWSPDGDEYSFDVLDNSDNFYVIRDNSVLHIVNHAGSTPLFFANVHEMHEIIDALEFRRVSATIAKKGRWRSRDSYVLESAKAERHRVEDRDGKGGGGSAQSAGQGGRSRSDPAT
ncbi:hypothetical protein [Glaciimonas sp. PAMC28666]|uniref:hypothetical protein n=1 Tax=Glaciimonas sp. PAMC28666 TaxID=2807626 RepID=UPI001965C8CC|nr:hypothetical protein [Glaciimonas sp. PAMC28666]QRX82073.1 hypothetical protein JQN73_18470 [Glaciimonas sp. PAMC28666]